MAGSTPIYGFPYPQSTDLVADYPTLGQELATDVETVISGLGSGLNIITPTSIANSGGTATASGGAVTFTGVTSVSLNGVFSSTYENYRVEIRLSGASTTISAYLRLRASGADSSTTYTYQQLTAGGSAVSATRIGASNTGTEWMAANTSTTLPVGISSDIFGPNIAAATAFHAISNYPASGATIEVYSGTHSTATAYTGLTLFVASGNITGTIRVYGYKNS